MAEKINERENKDLTELRRNREPSKEEIAEAEEAIKTLLGRYDGVQTKFVVAVENFFDSGNLDLSEVKELIKRDLEGYSEKAIDMALKNIAVRLANEWKAESSQAGIMQGLYPK